MRLGHVAVEGAGLEVHAWASEKGLVAVRFGAVDDAGARAGGRPVRGVEIAEPGKELRRLADALAEYLRHGRALDWDGALDLRGLTEFHRQVLDTVRAIPCGQTRSYREVARGLGRPQAMRAVGGALARNPVPIVVPCHRVLREGGALGGYSAGSETKRRLLALESGQTELRLPGGDR